MGRLLLLQLQGQLRGSDVISAGLRVNASKQGLLQLIFLQGGAMLPVSSLRTNNALFMNAMVALSAFPV